MFFRVFSVRKNGRKLYFAILFLMTIGSVFLFGHRYGTVGKQDDNQVLAIVTMDAPLDIWLGGEEFRLLTGVADNELLLGKDVISQRRRAAQIDSTIRQVAAGEKSFQSLGEDRIFRSSNVEKKQIALTFDDGPNERWTEKYLNLLEEKEIKASFFMLGKNAKNHPELVQKVAAAGHDIGIHSYDHADLKREDYTAIQEDLIQSQDTIASITGVAPTLFRPPYGSIDAQVIEVAQEQGLLMVLWNVDPQDWLLDTKEKVAKAVLDHVEPGNIVVMHEGKAVTFGALPMIIDTLKEEGYEFVTIRELVYESCMEQAERG
jgi:polysaccharide deacetylase family sporulation protein PdaB